MTLINRMLDWLLGPDPVTNQGGAPRPWQYPPPPKSAPPPPTTGLCGRPNIIAPGSLFEVGDDDSEDD